MPQTDLERRHDRVPHLAVEEILGQMVAPAGSPLPQDRGLLEVEAVGDAEVQVERVAVEVLVER
jgi:hypothetical protein